MTGASPAQLPRKFYQSVAVEGFENGWHIQLDGRTPVTPARNQLSMPTEKLAQSVAEEWDRQDTVIDLPRMTLTRLANVALDRTPETREELVDEVVKYAGTDLVCYLADGPSELRERQEAHFRPIRDWAGREHGVMLMTTEGVINAPQPQASLDAMHKYASRKDDFALTGLAMGLGLYGSAVLSMAVAEGELSATDAYDISRIDEMWQNEQWGVDDEARERVEEQTREAEALGKWFEGLARLNVA